MDHSAGTGSDLGAGFAVPREAPGQPVEEEIDHRRGVQGQHWLRIRPPTMVMPRGRRSSEPVPVPSASGTAAEQRGHGGHHDGAEAQQAGLVDGVQRRHALFALRVEREIDHHDGVLLHDADQQDDADQRDDAEIIAVQTISASSAPTPAEGSVERIVMGWM